MTNEASERRGFEMLKIVVCVSGGGTNLQAIMDAMDEGRITNVEIVPSSVIIVERRRLKGRLPGR